MSAPDLKAAIAEVERALKSATAEIGPSPAFAGDSAFSQRRGEVMTRCAEALTASLGAKINDRWDGCRVRIAGVTATCTAGMTGALHNWLAATRRKVQA